MSKFDKLSNQEIEILIKKSSSYTETCKNLGIAENGSNIKRLKDFVDKYDINTDHFKLYKSTITKEDYSKNPKLCKFCGNPLPWDKRNNVFCNASCASSYNNKNVTRNPEGVSNLTSSKLINISDEDFTNIITSSYTWEDIFIKLGYSKNSISSQNKDKIKLRAQQLGIALNIKAFKERDWNSVTKGELFEDRKNWQSARTQIRKLACAEFYKHNKECKCAICGYNKHVEVAHIKAVSEFDDSTVITTINNYKNLIGLCPNHHWEYDNGLLDIKPYIKE